MQSEIDWRHIAGAIVLLVLLAYGGLQLVNRSGDSPTVSAPAGVNRRSQDAPAQASGAPVRPGLPAAQ